MTELEGDPSNSPLQANGGDGAGGDESNSKQTKKKIQKANLNPVSLDPPTKWRGTFFKLLTKVRIKVN